MREANANYIDRNHVRQQQYTPAAASGQPQSITMRKRIGSTTYRVRVHMSETGTETMNDKILRMVKSEAVSK